MASTRPLSVSQMTSGWAVTRAWDATAAAPPGANTGQALMVMSSIIQPSETFLDSSIVSKRNLRSRSWPVNPVRSRGENGYVKPDGKYQRHRIDEFIALGKAVIHRFLSS